MPANAVMEKVKQEAVKQEAVKQEAKSRPMTNPLADPQPKPWDIAKYHLTEVRGIRRV